ncbi:hypothetical protein L7F22_047013 [Adiantum nelumboides]|nr:hypothetical protein [Adiantum nelumboides]
MSGAVLLVSLGSFLFFTLLSLRMIGVKDQKDWQDSVHHGGWTAKLIGWFLLRGACDFEEVEKMMAARDLQALVDEPRVVQVLILLDFTHSWNATWVAKYKQFWNVALLVASVISYLGTFTLPGLLYDWFDSCSNLITERKTTKGMSQGLSVKCIPSFMSYLLWQACT